MTLLDPGILACIIDRPDDDLPRLIAADWWEEHGEPERAEFCRVQLELASSAGQMCGLFFTDNDERHARCDACPGCLKTSALRCRERELLEAGPVSGECNYWNWCPDAVWDAVIHDARLVMRCPDDYPYRRGFIESVTMSAADWLRHRDALRAATPLRKLVVSDWDGAMTPPWIGDDGERLVMAAGIGDFWGLTCRVGRLYDGRVEVVAAGRPQSIFTPPPLASAVLRG